MAVSPGCRGSDREEARWNTAVALSIFDEPDRVPLFHAGARHVKLWRRWQAIYVLARLQ